MSASADKVIEDGAALNAKAVTDACIQVFTMGMQQAAKNAQRADDSYQKFSDGLDLIRLRACAGSTEDMRQLDQFDARAQKTLASGDLADTITGLQASLTAMMQFLKTGQSTPPETGGKPS